MIQTVPRLVLTLLLSLFIFSSCGDSDGSLFGPPDYSSVPDLPDTTSLEKVTLEEGLYYYVVEKGFGPVSIQNRDDISAYFSVRREDGTVFNSSWVNDSETPRRISVNTFGNRGIQMAFEGMKIGERRVVIVSPAWGYGNVPSNSQYYYLRNDQLTYDIQVDDVF